MTAIERTAFIKRHATGENEGLDPRFLPKETLRELGHPESPIAAIRANCIQCSGGSVGEARKCQSLLCPLWTFRMGVNPHHAKSSPRQATYTRGAPLTPKKPGPNPENLESNGICAQED
jgi:hypothetical protein